MVEKRGDCDSGDYGARDAPPGEGDPAVDRLEQSIRSGVHWYIALLESIAMWTRAEESLDNRVYHYLIAGEAFDWLLLAERLCDAINGLVPEDEKAALLFRSTPPLDLSPMEFRDRIGGVKYHQYLNYFYGITVEEALVLAVEEEVRKEKRAWGYTREHEATNEAYRRIYGPTFAIMLRHFRREKGYPETKSIDMTQLKEFAYWRFRYRLKACEKAKVASDTRKGLTWLKTHGVTSYVPRRESSPDAKERAGERE